MLIYTPHITTRVHYIVQHMAMHHFGIQINITNSLDEYTLYDGGKINYSEKENIDGLQIFPAGLLQLEAVQPLQINKAVYNNINCPFAVEKGDFPFDIFSAIFYLMSRYEEYLPHQQNQYGQFKAVESFAYKNNFLHLPIIDIWLNEFKNILIKKYPNLVFKPKHFNAQMSYDIDVAYAFKGKSFFKNIALIARDIISLDFNTFKNRLSGLKNINLDVFNTYDYIIKSNENVEKPILFFLVGDTHIYNKNLHWQSSEMQNLVNTIKKNVVFGLHPSYETPRNKKLITEEKNRLEQLTKNEVKISRQHYLRYFMPTTFNCLLQSGITNDYTMAFADMPGFRASTCTPFYFYDVVKDVQTNLLIHPITFMEGTFAEDLQMKPQEALPEMIALINEVKKVNGQFICIWHNHTLSDIGFWKGWKEVHNKLIEELIKTYTLQIL